MTEIFALLCMLPDLPRPLSSAGPGCVERDPAHVTVRLIGEAVEGTERGVICASFNAG